jgi:hypothetical protein
VAVRLASQPLQSRADQNTRKISIGRPTRHQADPQQGKTLVKVVFFKLEWSATHQNIWNQVGSSWRKRFDKRSGSRFTPARFPEERQREYPRQKEHFGRPG